MPDGVSPEDPRWHRLLGLAVHEFRTPVSVVGGYLRMLLTGRAGELSDQQKKLLREAEKSCGRLSGIIAEMSDLANLEAGSATFNRSTVDVVALLQESAASLPPTPDREIPVVVSSDVPSANATGDPTRLRTAFASVMYALRRELVTSDRLAVRLRRHEHNGRDVLWIAVAGDDEVGTVANADGGSLVPFDEWRGGSGLSLAVARRVFNAHGGSLMSPDPDLKSCALIVLPEA